MAKRSSAAGHGRAGKMNQKKSFKQILLSPMLLAVCCSISLIARAQSATPQATPPPPAAPRAVKFPTPVEKTLANGLRVIVVERHGSPLVAAQLLIKNGAEVDPPQLAGLSNITADLLTKG